MSKGPSRVGPPQGESDVPKATVPGTGGDARRSDEARAGFEARGDLPLASGSIINDAGPEAATYRAGFHPLGPNPAEVEQMMGEIILRVMAWAAQAELESIKRHNVARAFGVSRQTIRRAEQPEYRRGPPARWYHCGSGGPLT